MKQTIIYIRKTNPQKELDPRIAHFPKSKIFIEQGLETVTLKKLIKKLKPKDELIVLTFAHLGTSSEFILKNIQILMKKGVVISSISENIRTDQLVSWEEAVLFFEIIKNRMIGVLSSQRLMAKRNKGIHVGRKKKQLDEEKLLEQFDLHTRNEMTLQEIADYHHVGRTCIAKRFRQIRERKQEKL